MNEIAINVDLFKSNNNQCNVNFTGTTRLMSSTSKLKILTFRPFILIPWSIPFLIGTQCPNRPKTFFLMTMRTLNWMKPCSLFCKIVLCTRTTLLTALVCSGRQGHLIWGQAGQDAHLMYLWLRIGIVNIVLRDNPSKSVWAIRNCWNIMSWMRSTIDRPNHRRSDTCSGLLRPQNFSSPQLWTGLKLAFRSAAKATICWIYWFIVRTWITYIWTTISTWNLWKHWRRKSAKNHVLEMLFTCAGKFCVWPSWLWILMFNIDWTT